MSTHVSTSINQPLDPILYENGVCNRPITLVRRAPQYSQMYIEFASNCIKSYYYNSIDIDMSDTQFSKYSRIYIRFLYRSGDITQGTITMDTSVSSDNAYRQFYINGSSNYNSVPNNTVVERSVLLGEMSSTTWRFTTNYSTSSSERYWEIYKIWLE